MVQQQVNREQPTCQPSLLRIKTEINHPPCQLIHGLASVPHVHVHIIPRRFEDLTHSDDIYTMLESEEGDLGKIFREHGDGPREAHQPDTLSEPARVITDAMEEMVLTGVMQAPVSSAEQPGLQQQQQVALPAVGMGTRPKFPVPLPDELRKPRTTEEMREEAQLLERYMDDYHAFRMIL